MRKINEKLRLILSQSVYDRATKEFGENCGYDKNKVEAIRGYSLFDDKKLKTKPLM